MRGMFGDNLRCIDNDFNQQLKYPVRRIVNQRLFTTTGSLQEALNGTLFYVSKMEMQVGGQWMCHDARVHSLQ